MHAQRIGRRLHLRLGEALAKLRQPVHVTLVRPERRVALHRLLCVDIVAVAVSRCSSEVLQMHRVAVLLQLGTRACDQLVRAARLLADDRLRLKAAEERGSRKHVRRPRFLCSGRCTPRQRMTAVQFRAGAAHRLRREIAVRARSLILRPGEPAPQFVHLMNERRVVERRVEWKIAMRAASRSVADDGARRTPSTDCERAEACRAHVSIA